jgi:hypothetical protein
MRRFFPLLGAFLPLLFLAGCETAPPGIQAAKVAMAQKYATETPGDYFIGRRYYKPDFKFWGYVRRPGQPWSESQLVMLNEKQKLAPDREKLDFGSDNNYEYVAEMPGRRFSRLSFSSLMKKRQARSYIRLQFSRCAPSIGFCVARKKLASIRCARNAVAKAGKEIAARPDTRQQIDELLRAACACQKNRPRHPGCRCATPPSWNCFTAAVCAERTGALDVADVDLYTESVRVFGKGRKERVCPVGCRRSKRSRVIARRPTSCRPALHQQSAAANFAALDLADVETLFAAHVHSDFRSARTNCGTASPRTCSIAAPICAACRPYSATPVFRRRRSTRTSPSSG